MFSPAQPARHSVHHTQFVTSPDGTEAGADDTPQVWRRLDAMSRALAGTSADRQAKCCRTRIVAPGASVLVRRSDTGVTWLSGVVRCGHMTCPACGVARARRAAAELGAVIGHHLAAGGMYADAWMLTLTVPHTASDLTGETVADLFDAWRQFTRSRSWREFRKRWGIVSVVRALDVTFGGSNGTHPHFHVCLLPRLAAVTPWQSFRGLEADGRAMAVEDAGAELVDAWVAAVMTTGRRARSVGTMRAVSCKLTPGERAESYFTGWALHDEVTAAAAKRRSHLALLDEDSDLSRHFYYVWRLAVDGRQWVSGLGDALALAGISTEDVDARVAARDERERGDLPPVEEVAVPIPATAWASALRAGLGNVVEAVRRAPSGEVARQAVWALLTAPARPAPAPAPMWDDAPPGMFPPAWALGVRSA